MKKIIFSVFVICILFLLSGCLQKNWQCEDFCGDGNCDLNPCKGEYCPCQESASSCPTDCQ